jgi:hypothetical protein
MIILLLALVACEDSERVAEKKRAEQAHAERTAKLKAEADAEQELMRAPERAIPVLQQRMSGWLTVSEGVAIVVDEKSYSAAQVYALPLRGEWLVSCGRSGIDVAITNLASEYIIVRRLTRAQLTADECRPLAAAVGARLQALGGKVPNEKAGPH